MKLLVALAIFSALLLVAAQNADAAKTERTITIKIQKVETKFVVKTYDFERKVSIDVSDAMLKKIKNAFGTDTFVFYNQVSKKQTGQDSISISPKIQVGQKLQVKFI
jgi:hypothetical protein